MSNKTLNNSCEQKIIKIVEKVNDNGQTEKIVYKENIIKKEVPQIKLIEKPVERIIENIITKENIIKKENVVEVTVNQDKEHIVEQIVEIEKEKIIEVPVEVIIERPIEVETIVEKEVKIFQEVVKEIEVEKIVDVEVDNELYAKIMELESDYRYLEQLNEKLNRDIVKYRQEVEKNDKKEKIVDYRGMCKKLMKEIALYEIE